MTDTTEVAAQETAPTQTPEAQATPETNSSKPSLSAEQKVAIDFNILNPTLGSERKEEDPNVITLVSGILETAGHASPKAWESDEKIKQAQSFTPQLQITAINEHFRRKLGNLEESTRTPRLALADGVDVAEYTTNFEKYVAPTLVRTGV